MMSKTFTSRPTATRGTPRGRGRGVTPAGRGRASTVSPAKPPTQANSRTNRMWEESPPPTRRPGPPKPPAPANHIDGAAPVQAAGTEQQDRVQRRDAYTMIQPNQQKRAAHASVAQKEEMEYQQYKERQKLGAVSYVGTAGGGQVSPATIRERQQQQHQSNFRGAYARGNQHRGLVKQKEEADNLKRKQEARNKAVTNERRETSRSAELRPDHRERNTAFLDRLERESKEKSRAKILQKAQTSSTTETYGGGASAAAASYEDEGRYDNPDPVDVLTQEFHQFDSELIQAVVTSVGGDIRKARRSLCEMGDAG